MRTMSRIQPCKRLTATTVVGALAQFVVSMPSSPLAGSAFQVAVRAADAWGHPIITNTSTVSFSGTAGTLPGSAQLSGGLLLTSATYTTLGAKTLTATDSVTSSLTGSASGVVQAGVATRYTQFVTLGGTNTVTAGHAVSFRVTPGDQFNNITSSYLGTVHMTSTDPLAVLPTDLPWQPSFGTQQTLQAVLNTVGTFTVTVTDTVTSSITKTIGTALVVVTDPFFINGPLSVIVGQALLLGGTALNHDGTVNTGYDGTVTVTSSDPLAVLPANFEAFAFFPFLLTLKTLGLQTVTVTDIASSAISGTFSIYVASPAGSPAYYVMQPGYLPYVTVTAGATTSITMEAVDSNGAVQGGYSGTCRFVSPDTQATGLSNRAFTSGVAGPFNVVLKTVGHMGISAVDTVTNTIIGNQPLFVLAAVVAGYTIVTPSNTINGAAFTFTVKPIDAYGNPTSGSVHFSSNDTNAVLPANASIASGATGTFTATLKTTATKTITVADVTTSAISTVSSNITVAASGAMFLFSLTQPGAVAGSVMLLTVRAIDANNQTVPTYAGTVRFTSNDTQAVLPVNSTLTSGLGTFSVTMKTAGSHTVTVTDTVTAAFTRPTTVAVSSPGFQEFAWSGVPASASIGETVTLTVTAQDHYSNVATSYIGPVSFSSTDPDASLGPEGLGSGVELIEVIFVAAGIQTVTVVDGQASGITKDTSGIVVA